MPKVVVVRSLSAPKIVVVDPRLRGIGGGSSVPESWGYFATNSLPLVDDNVTIAWRTDPPTTIVGAEVELIESVPDSGVFDNIRVLADGRWQFTFDVVLTLSDDADGIVWIQFDPVSTFDDPDYTRAVWYQNGSMKIPIRPTTGNTSVALPWSYPIVNLKAGDVMFATALSVLGTGTATFSGGSNLYAVRVG